MKALAQKVLGRLHFNLEQVQDLTPTPMTLSSVMFYTGENPYTREKVYVARSQEEKRRQKSYFFRQQSENPDGFTRRFSGKQHARPGGRIDKQAGGPSENRTDWRNGFGQNHGRKKG